MWQQINYEMYLSIYNTTPLELFESFTDTFGQHGKPSIITVWGKCDQPVIKSEAHRDAITDVWQYAYYQFAPEETSIMQDLEELIALTR